MTDTTIGRVVFNPAKPGPGHTWTGTDGPTLDIPSHMRGVGNREGADAVRPAHPSP